MRIRHAVPFVLVIVSLVVFVAVEQRAGQPVEEEECNPCLEFATACDVKPGRWCTRRAKNDSGLRRVLTDIERTLCVTDPYILVAPDPHGGEEFVVVFRAVCGAGS